MTHVVEKLGARMEGRWKCTGWPGSPARPRPSCKSAEFGCHRRRNLAIAIWSCRDEGPHQPRGAGIVPACDLAALGSSLFQSQYIMEDVSIFDSIWHSIFTSNRQSCDWWWEFLILEKLYSPCTPHVSPSFWKPGATEEQSKECALLCSHRHVEELQAVHDVVDKGCSVSSSLQRKRQESADLFTPSAR